MQFLLFCRAKSSFASLAFGWRCMSLSLTIAIVVYKIDERHISNRQYCYQGHINFVYFIHFFFFTIYLFILVCYFFHFAKWWKQHHRQQNKKNRRATMSKKKFIGTKKKITREKQNVVKGNLESCLWYYYC